MGQEGWLSMILLLLEVVFLCFLVEILVFVFLLKKSRRSGARRLFQRFVIVGDVHEFVVVVEEEWDYSQDLLLLMILLLLLVDYVVEFLLSFMFLKRSRRSGQQGWI